MNSNGENETGIKLTHSNDLDLLHERVGYIF